MVFQKILLVPIPFVQRKKPISKRANQTPNDSVSFSFLKTSHTLIPGDNFWWHKRSDHGGHGGESGGLSQLGHLAPGHLQAVLTWGSCVTSYHVMEHQGKLPQMRWLPTWGHTSGPPPPRWPPLPHCTDSGARALTSGSSFSLIFSSRTVTIHQTSSCVCCQPQPRMSRGTRGKRRRSSEECI